MSQVALAMKGLGLARAGTHGRVIVRAGFEIIRAPVGMANFATDGGDADFVNGPWADERACFAAELFINLKICAVDRAELVKKVVANFEAVEGAWRMAGKEAAWALVFEGKHGSAT